MQCAETELQSHIYTRARRPANSGRCSVLSLLCAPLPWNGVSFFPPSISKHLSTFTTMCIPLHFSLPHIQWGDALCSAEWEAREPARQVCAQSAIVTFPCEATGIFPTRKPTGFFLFSVLGRLSLPKPPKSDTWCWLIITGISICPWFTWASVQCKVMQRLEHCWIQKVQRESEGYFMFTPLAAPWVVFLLQVQSKVLHHARE